MIIINAIVNVFARSIRNMIVFFVRASAVLADGRRNGFGIRAVDALTWCT